MAKKIRVYELARELGLTNKEGLELALSMGIGVTSHSSSIEEAQADRVRRRAERDGLKRAHPPEEAPAAPAVPDVTPASVPAPSAGPRPRDPVMVHNLYQLSDKLLSVRQWSVRVVLWRRLPE